MTIYRKDGAADFFEVVGLDQDSEGHMTASIKINGTAPIKMRAYDVLQHLVDGNLSLNPAGGVTEEASAASFPASDPPNFVPSKV